LNIIELSNLFIHFGINNFDNFYNSIPVFYFLLELTISITLVKSMSKGYVYEMFDISNR